MLLKTPVFYFSNPFCLLDCFLLVYHSGPFQMINQIVLKMALVFICYKNAILDKLDQDIGLNAVFSAQVGWNIFILYKT